MRHWRRLRVRVAPRHCQLMGFPFALPPDGGIARSVPLLGSDPLLRLCSPEDAHWATESVAFGKFVVARLKLNKILLWFLGNNHNVSSVFMHIRNSESGSVYATTGWPHTTYDVRHPPKPFHHMPLTVS